MSVTERPCFKDRLLPPAYALPPPPFPQTLCAPHITCDCQDLLAVTWLRAEARLLPVTSCFWVTGGVRPIATALAGASPSLYARAAMTPFWQQGASL